eukprot:749300-Hanusia_phi.AAC.10
MTNVDPNDSRIKKFSQILASVGMYPEDSVAMFDYDSSEASILLGYAIVTGQCKPLVMTRWDTEGLETTVEGYQAAYGDNREQIRCVGIIIPDEDRLKELMDAGPGLESRCGWDPSSPVGPRFALRRQGRSCRTTSAAPGARQIL